MLAVADALDALRWVENIGGLRTTIARSEENSKALENWVARTGWVDFLAETPDIRSTTSVCLKIVDPWFAGLADEDKAPFIKSMTKLLDEEGAAYDIAGYRDAPAGLRIWCGATVQAGDVEALCPWLDWAFEVAKAQEQKKRLRASIVLFWRCYGAAYVFLYAARRVPSQNKTLFALVFETQGFSCFFISVFIFGAY